AFSRHFERSASCVQAHRLLERRRAHELVAHEHARSTHTRGDRKLAHASAEFRDQLIELRDLRFELWRGLVGKGLEALESAGEIAEGLLGATDVVEERGLGVE